MSATVTIEHVSASLDPEAFGAVVTVPTFRRPEHLRETLRSLAAQDCDIPFAVIVIENDTENRAGLQAAMEAFAEFSLPGLVVVAHRRGNCWAYNAGWETALATFPAMRHLLVLDDDELASPGWASALLKTAGATSAAIVGGPVIPVFPEGKSERLLRHPVFTAPYRVTGPVPILYGSGNVLLTRDVLESMPRPYLDPAFNFIGGGDADFFARARRAGFDFAWAEDALIHETTPARRMEFSWLQARGLREGALSLIIERRGAATASQRLGTLAKSAALLAASPFRSLRLGLSTRSFVVGLYPIHVAVGRFLGEFGLVHEQYREPEQN